MRTGEVLFELGQDVKGTELFEQLYRCSENLAFLYDMTRPKHPLIFTDYENCSAELPLTKPFKIRWERQVLKKFSPDGYAKKLKLSKTVVSDKIYASPEHLDFDWINYSATYSRLHIVVGLTNDTRFDGELDSVMPDLEQVTRDFYKLLNKKRLEYEQWSEESSKQWEEVCKQILIDNFKNKTW